MAAISNVILALAEAGSNIVTTRYLFGNTYSLFQNTLKPWGLHTTYVNLEDENQLRAALNENTRAVFLETITNPQLQVVDIKNISKIAHERGVPVVVDGTLTTPCLLPTKSVGADIEVISSTKYMSGGATSLGGVIIDNGLFDWSLNPKLKPWADKAGPQAFLVYLRREVYRNLGSCLSAHNAWLQSLGLESMRMRVQKSCENAGGIARFLGTVPGVTQVNYPGLDNSPWHQNAAAQFQNGFGALLTFTLQSKEACFSFIDALKLVRRATNLNDNKTLIIHPASTIFCEYSREEREQMGVGDALIRLSVGIEDLDDIIDDLKTGFQAVGKAAKN